MKLKCLLICIIVLLLSVNISYAEPKKLFAKDFELTYEAVNNKVSIGNEAEFKFNVKNKNPRSERFRVINTATDFDLRTSPLHIKLSGLRILPNSVGDEFSVFLVPIEGTRLGEHEVVLNLRFESGMITELPLYVYVEPESALKDTYETSISVDVVFNDKLDPRNEFVMNINLDNLNKKELDDVEVKIEGNLINEVIVADLEPLEKSKVLTFKKTFDKYIKPQSDNLLITVIADQEIVTSFSKQLEIIDYTGKFTEDIAIKRNILSTIYTLAYTNDGNSPRAEIISHPVSAMTKIFTSSEPKANVVYTSEGDRLYSWQLALNPGESKTIIVKTSVQTPAIIFLVILGLFGYYYYNRSPVVVVKRAVRLSKTQGDISEIKVSVSIKNFSSQKIANVSITDYVPSIAYVINEFVVGTLHPTKIMRHETRGDSVLKWELENIDPKEDRILTYKIKTKLGIIGNMTLPPVTVKYKKDEKFVVVKSNSFSIEA